MESPRTDPIVPPEAVRRKRRLWRQIAYWTIFFVFLWFLGTGVATALYTRRLTGPSAEPMPREDWGNLMEVRLRTADGQTIGAWVNRRGDKPTIALLLHGVGDTRAWWLPVMQRLADHGYGSMAITFRAHGDSTGTVEDFGYSAQNDVIAAVDYLHRGFPGRPVVVVGSSLGAAAAIFAARSLDHEVSGYFLESPYRDLETAVWNRTNAAPPPFNWLAYEGMELWGRILLPEPAHAIRPIDRVADIPADAPVTFVAARHDPWCKLGEVEDLYHKIESHARLVVFQSARHGACSRTDPLRYDAALLELLSRTDVANQGDAGFRRSAASAIVQCGAGQSLLAFKPAPPPRRPLLR